LKVSVIIPVYNGAKFIEKAYQQLINQRLESVEYIFIDNNSTDNSLKIIQHLQKENRRVKLFEEKVQGAASARNKGLKEARGNYIYFFDVDDQLYPSALTSLMKVLDEYEIDSVFGKSIRSCKNIDETQKPESDTNKINIFRNKELGYLWFQHYGKLPNPPSFMHKKKVFNKIGFFNPELLLGEDAAFHIKLGLDCTVASLDKYITLYYRHSESTVSKQNKKQPHRVFTYWEPLIKEHLPYALKNSDLKFKKLTLNRLFGFIAKMLFLTKGYNNSVALRKRVALEILPVKIPIVFKVIYTLLTFIKSEYLYKFFVFYIVERGVKYVKIRKKY